MKRKDSPKLSETVKKIQDDSSIRLNKYISNHGICSRREADKLILEGKVKVNGAIITELGHKIDKGAEVLVNNQKLKAQNNIYILLNKPKGYITTTKDPENRKTVMDLIAN